MNLRATLADRRTDPFDYCLFSSLFSDNAYATVLAWLESAENWTLVESDFYEQFEFCVDDLSSVPSPVRFLLTRQFRQAICKIVGEQFGKVPSEKNIRLVAHKLTPGQAIGIHNDVIEGGEEHRLTVQFNEGLSEQAGGYFMLFNSDNPADIHRILLPRPNSAIAFAVSENSHHAVSQLLGGVRYTLIFNFT